LQRKRAQLCADRSGRDEPPPDCERGVERDQDIGEPDRDRDRGCRGDVRRDQIDGEEQDCREEIVEEM
jgi:hypothetical protein